jgi:hypothetical protein
MKLQCWMTRLFQKPRKIEEPVVELSTIEEVQHPRVFHMWKHTGWGNRISWFEPDKVLVGWLTLFNNQHAGYSPDGLLYIPPMIENPRTGDYIGCKMQRGAMGRYRVTSHKHFSDPADMFFADVEQVGTVGYAAITIESDDGTSSFGVCKDDVDSIVFRSSNEEEALAELHRLMDGFIIPDEVLF